MDILAIIKEAFTGSFSSVFKIACIVIPLMILLELGKEYHIIEYLSKKCMPFTKAFRMSGEATFPWLVGLIFGISYGAGVLVQAGQDGLLSEQDKFLLGSFLILCHAVFEDTLLFVALSANGIVIFVLRFLAALGWTFFVSRQFALVKKKKI